MAKKLTLSLVVPAFNEEKRIFKKFDRAYKLLSENVKSFEIILINDGSVDKTENILNEISKKYKNVKVISYFPNKGKGYAVKKGILEAKGEIVGFTDADFAISLDNLPQTIDLINSGFQVVIGNRKSKASNLENNPEIIRRLFSFIHSRVNNFFLNLGPVKDTLCGYKFFQRGVAQSLFKDLDIYRWFFDLEILIKARNKNIKIYQQPVSWEEVRGGQVRIIDAIKSSLKEHLLIYSKFFNSKIFSVFLLGIIFLILFPFLINPESLTKRNGDFSDLVWPDYFFIRDSIYRNHQVPLWNNTVFSGIPEIANPQSPLIYPLNIIALILPLDLGIVVLIGLHIFIAALYLFRLAKEKFAFSNIASIVLSFGVVFSPFYISKFSVGHLSMGFAMLLISPILYYGVSLTKKFKKADLFFLSFFLSLQYLNYPTIWYYTCLFGIIAVLFIFKSFKKTYIFILSALISLIIILPIFLLQLQAGTLITRSKLVVADLSIPIWSIKRFITSILVPSNFLGDKETEVWLYPGLGLVVASIFGYFNLIKKYKIIVGVLSFLIILITLGSRTPFFELLVKILPGFSYLRVSTRDWFLINIILAILAGWFINKLTKKKQKIIGLIILIDLLLFSTVRLWFVPQSMVFDGVNKFRDILINSFEYRYYCTSRCLSARDSLPNGVLTADGYHLLILHDYRDVLSNAGGFSPPKYTGNIPATENVGMQPSASKLGKLGVKWVISPYEVLDTGFVHVNNAGNYKMYENRLVLDRVRFLNSKNIARIILDTPNRIVISSENTTDKLILADPYYPGWEAKVDGEKVKIEKYDNWARLIEVSEGNHKIEFEYKPFLSLLKL